MITHTEFAQPGEKNQVGQGKKTYPCCKMCDDDDRFFIVPQVGIV